MKHSLSLPVKTWRHTDVQPIWNHLGCFTNQLFSNSARSHEFKPGDWKISVEVFSFFQATLQPLADTRTSFYCWNKDIKKHSGYICHSTNLSLKQGDKFGNALWNGGADLWLLEVFIDILPYFWGLVCDAKALLFLTPLPAFACWWLISKAW